MTISILKNQNKQSIIAEMQKVGVDSCGIEIMSSKANFFIIRLDKIKNISANILKQQMLSLGGDAAVSKETLRYPDKETGVLLIGNEYIYLQLIEKLKVQPFGLQKVALEIKDLLGYSQDSTTHHSLFTTHHKKVMGILNVTPDSFFDGNKYSLIENAVLRAKEMRNQGADIIDIGGESTRPGAEYIALEEEKKRVLPVCKELAGEKDINLSIDTNKSEIAQECLAMGAKIINDVSGLTKDKNMAKVIAEHNAKVIIMHSQGNPKEMQKSPCYNNIINEIIKFLTKQIEFACKKGIKRENILIDPGIGFGKTTAHNLIIIKELGQFKSLGCPIVIGVSRKSFIGSILNKEPEQRLSGSISAGLISAINGADILRVHDVEETFDALKLLGHIKC